MGKGGSLFLDSVNTTVYAEHLLFFRDSGILVHAKAEGAYQPPVKILGTEFPMGLPAQKHHMCVAAFSSLGEE